MAVVVAGNCHSRKMMQRIGVQVNGSIRQQGAAEPCADYTICTSCGCAVRLCRKEMGECAEQSYC